MNAEALDKVKVCKRSLRCFVFGLLSVIPFLGIISGLLAIHFSGLAKVQEKKIWNPARRYRIFGLICSILGILLWSGIGLIMVFNILYPT